MRTESTTTSTKRESLLFESEAIEIMRLLRAAFMGLVEGLSAPIHRPADLERALGISTTLAWQLHRVASAPNPMSAGPDVPGAAALQQVLRAARSRGVDESRLRAAEDAMRSFDALIQSHAGNRHVFNAMIKSLADGEARYIDIKSRRQAFNTNSQIWGVQVKAMLACAFHHPGDMSAHVDFALIRGMRNIRRLRTGAPFHLSGTRLKDAHQHLVDPRHPKDRPLPESPGLILMEDFCSQPCPELEHRLAEDGYVESYLGDTPLGNAGAQTLYLSQVMRGAEWKEPDGKPNSHTHRYMSLKPTEALVLDTLIHRDMYGPLSPEVTVRGSLNPYGGAAEGKYHPDEVLPIDVEVHNLGTGLGALPTPHVPRYAEIVKSLCRDLAWDPDGFEIFRCVYEYPVLGSELSMRFTLPEKGNW